MVFINNMNIQAINNTYYNKKPSFRSWEREVYSAKKGVINRNNTCFFRDGIFFEKLTKMLSEKFTLTPKVNVYCYGCSDGSEAFSFIIKMLTTLEEDNPKKFFPVIAKDIDNIAIQKALHNDYKITNDEKFSINKFTENQFERFFYQPQNTMNNNSEQMRVRVNTELYDYVDFQVGDILKDYKNIEPKNSVVFARNFWPYIKDYNIRTGFFKDLYKHLDFGSYFIIGDFDKRGIGYMLQGNLEKDILKTGFRPTEVKNVYVKSL